MQSQRTCIQHQSRWQHRQAAALRLPFGSSSNEASRHRQQQRCSVVVAARREADDVLLRSLSELGEVAVLVLDGTNLVREVQRRHKTAPTATAALGRTMMGALLIGSFRKDQEVVQISFRGDGPIGSILAIADTKGNVKGRVENPSADPPLRPDGKLNVGAAVGKGTLSVIRTHPLQPNPFTGIVPIVSGEIAEDLANYLVDSEQTNSALGLGVALNRDCEVTAAGGWLVQVLPFCSEETLSQLEANLSGLQSATQMLMKGMTPETITDAILRGLGRAEINTVPVTPKYGPCNSTELQERMLKTLARFSPAEIRDIMDKEGKLEVTCEMCAETYQFSEAQVMAMRERIVKNVA